jgi:hypothetical protein
MKKLLISLVAVLTLLVGYVSVPQARERLGYVAQDYYAYPTDEGFPPEHWSWRSPVMARKPYLGRPGPRLGGPAWGYGAGYPTDEGFPPDHLYGPSTVMHPRSRYIYPGPWIRRPMWRY